MNSSERSQSLRDPPQITFIMLNRFWSLSKKTFTPLFSMDNIKLDGMPTNIKLKIKTCFTLYFKFWEGSSVKSYKIQPPVLLFLVSHLFLYQQISFSFNFLELHSALSEKDFCGKFSFFNEFTQTPHPINSQNLLSVTKVFCQFFLKCFLKYFLNICWQNLAKGSFTYQQWTATVHIFLKVPATDSRVFFSEHISRTAIFTQASVIICK